MSRGWGVSIAEGNLGRGTKLARSGEPINDENDCITFGANAVRIAKQTPIDYRRCRPVYVWVVNGEPGYIEEEWRMRRRVQKEDCAIGDTREDSAVQSEYIFGLIQSHSTDLSLSNRR